MALGKCISFGKVTIGQQEVKVIYSDIEIKINSMNRFICFILFIFYCLHSLAQVDKGQVRDEYKKILSLYPDSLTNHFPNPISDNIGYLDVEYPGATRINSIYAIFHYKDKQIECIKKRAKSIALANYRFVDSCLMMTNCDASWYTPVIEDIIRHEDCPKVYPIPNFSFLKEFNPESDFFEKAQIYVLRAEKGKFLDDKLLRNEGVGLSESWLHGYTKGIMISGNFVIYWLEVW